MPVSNHLQSYKDVQSNFAMLFQLSFHSLLSLLSVCNTTSKHRTHSSYSQVENLYRALIRSSFLRLSKCLVCRLQTRAREVVGNVPLMFLKMLTYAS